MHRARFLSLLLIGCAATTPSPPDVPLRPPARSFAPPFADAAPSHFFSKRFHATIPFPDGRTWRIDDHSSAELVATHAPTESVLTFVLWREQTPVNRHICESRRPPHNQVALRTVEDTVELEPFDMRVWVPIELDSKGSLVGHVFAFGAHLRKCFVLHFATRVAGPDDQAALTSRLAAIRLTVVGGLRLDRTDAPHGSLQKP